MQYAPPENCVNRLFSAMEFGTPSIFSMCAMKQERIKDYIKTFLLKMFLLMDTPFILSSTVMVSSYLNFILNQL